MPLQGSGTFAAEAMLAMFVSNHAPVLVLANGAYGERLKGIAPHNASTTPSFEKTRLGRFDVAALDIALAGALTFSNYET